MKLRASVPGYQTTEGMGLCMEEKANSVPFFGLHCLKPGDPKLLYDYSTPAQERTQVFSQSGLWKVKQLEIKKSHLPFGWYFIKYELFFSP